MRKKKRKVRKRSFRISKTAVTVFIILACIGAIVVTDFVHRSKYSMLKQFDPSRTKGHPDAPLNIIEFLDFHCQECARGHHMMKQYWQQYPEDLFLQVKYYPVGHNTSAPLKTAIYAECSARQGKFWDFHDLLFERQQQWLKFVNPEPLIKIFASNAGLDKNQLDACVGGEEARAVVLTEKSYGEAFFVKATPTYFVNGDMVVGVEALRKRLESYFQEKQLEPDL